MDFVLLKIDSPEWNHIWEWLEKHPLNEGLEEPSIALNNNEQWQYVGTYKKGNKAISDMRHRLHPVTNRLEILSIEHDITDEGIEKKFRV